VELTGRRSGTLAGVVRAALTGPGYEASAADLRTITVAGLELPVRASVVLLAVTALLVLDATDAIGPLVGGGLRGADPGLARATERFVLFGLMPLAIVVLGFRDSPARYGVTLGLWRWGLPLLVAGLAIMTPIIAALSTLSDFRTYYGHGGVAPLETVVANALEVVPAEFLFRGFLLFVLLRRIGPLALVVTLVPFVLTHIGKPEIELWSTFFGGMVFAWLDWRTGSVLWSALGHLYVLTLMILLAAGAAAAAS
jgi:uncharacterized protein